MIDGIILNECLICTKYGQERTCGNFPLELALIGESGGVRKEEDAQLEVVRILGKQDLRLGTKDKCKYFAVTSNIGG